MTRLAICATLAWYGCSGVVLAQAVPPPALPSSRPLETRGAIRVGVLTDSYPFSFVDETGESVGFVVDLLAAIESTMALNLERVPGTTSEINRAFARGELDMLQTYAESPSREALADFSVPYLTMAGSIFTRRDVRGITRLDDLRGRRVLVHEDSLGEQVLAAAGLADTIVPVASVEDAFAQLESGLGDATLASRLRGLMVVHRRSFKQIVAVGEPVPGYEVRYTLAVKDGDRQLLARLNEGLAIVERTGVADGIYRKWFGPAESVSYSPFRIALWVAVGLAIALAIVFWSMLRQRALAARLREQQAQMHRAQKLEALGTLSSGIAHDFNNVLTTIIGNAEVLRSDLPPASAMADQATDILLAAERAQRLVAQILTFARRTEPKRQVVALGPLIDETIRFLRATTPSAIEITHRDSGADVLVEVDPTQVHQALMNVGTNAVYAMQGRAGHLEVREARVLLDAAAAARAHVPPGDYACVTMRDTGSGIASDVLPRIFDPFFTTKQPGEGTGLGLAVVLGILQAHGGGVSVASAPGAGAEVRLYFPLATRDAGPAPLEDALSRPQGHGRRVLLIDDEAPIVRSIELVLTRLGYEVTGRVDAADALAELEAAPTRFDVLITDLTMPDMSGMAVIARARAIRPDLPVLLLSGYFVEADLARARLLRVNAVIDKPVTGDTLAERLAECLAGVLRPTD